MSRVQKPCAWDSGATATPWMKQASYYIDQLEADLAAARSERDDFALAVVARVINSLTPMPRRSWMNPQLAIAQEEEARRIVAEGEAKGAKGSEDKCG